MDAVEVPSRLPARTPVEPDQASPARVYDWLLGGSHNFAVDRQVARQIVKIAPQVPDIARANRHFLRRAVRAVAAAGVDQFLDLGSGIPTAGNVHEVAREVRPGARVVYVDLDPVAIEYSRAILGDDPNSCVLRADLLDYRRILRDPALHDRLDFSRPVGLLLVAVGHFIPDDFRLNTALSAYRAAVPAGSHLIISHGSAESPWRGHEQIEQLYARSGTAVVSRDRKQLTTMIRGWVPLEPGLVYTPEWRPEDGVVDDPAGYSTLAVVARKP
jgi:hypothetical protein